MTVIFNITGDENGPTSVTAFFPDSGDATPVVANTGHNNFERILDYLGRTAADVLDETILQDLFDVAKAIEAAFERLGERVTIKGETLYLDNDAIAGVLADTIVAYYEEGNDDLGPLVTFMENLAANPSEASKDSLYAWMKNKSFSITDDGCILAYKSVSSYGSDEDDVFMSISYGTAIVDGETITGTIPNYVGAVVEMPRSEVDDNTGNACSTGLHVGTHGYASTFSGDVLLTVKVNPRDVVSVPRDSSEQKMRVCRYTVVERVGGEVQTLAFSTPEVDPLAPAAKPKTKRDIRRSDDYKARLAEVNGLNRDAVRAIASKADIAGRGSMTKDALVQAVVDAEYGIANSNV